MFLIFYVIAVAKEPNSRIRCGSGNDFFFTEICLISSVFLEPKLCQELLKPSRPITDPPSSTCYPLFQITPVPNTNLWPQLFHSSHFSRSKALTQSSRGHTNTVWVGTTWAIWESLSTQHILWPYSDVANGAHFHLAPHETTLGQRLLFLSGELLSLFPQAPANPS